MNKIFNINLGGYPFTIDEDAYEHLSAYLETIHRHFRQSEGYEEITEDIEARLAEIFREKLGNRPIVSIKDVKEAIVTMGTPEEFGADPLGEEADEETSSARRQYKTGKRLFRNPEEEVIGGVCSGIAAYFGIQDPLWVRLAFIILTVSGGFGIPLYIILWVVVPKAESASDRLAMRGEPINVSNIGKIIEEEFKNFSNKVTELGEEIGAKKKSFSAGGGNELRTALAKGIHILGQILRRLIEAFARIWKPILILIGFALLIAFAVSWIASVVGLFYSFPFLEYLNPGSRFYTVIAPINVLFVIGIPLIGLGMLVARLAFGARIHPNWRVGMSAFWVANFVALCYWGSMVVRDFSAGSDVSDRFYISPLTNDTLTLIQGEDSYENAWYSFGDGLKYNGEELISRDIVIHIDRSESGQFELVKQVYSRGRTVGMASELARSVRYEMQQEGNKIILLPAMAFPKGTNWRNQRVELTLSVPEGKFIRLDERLAWQVRRMDLAEGQQIVYENNTLWHMEENGLVCLNCPPQEDKKQFDLGSFTRLKVDGGVKVNVEQDENNGQDFLVSLQGKEHLLEEIDVVLVDQTLMVSTDKKYFSSPVYLNIKLPALQSLYLENTDDVKILGLKQQKIDLTIVGENEIKAYVDADSLDLRQEGRNKLDLRGVVDWLDATLTEHARLDAEKTEISGARLRLSQYSNALLPKIAQLDSKAEENSKVSVDGVEVK